MTWPNPISPADYRGPLLQGGTVKKLLKNYFINLLHGWNKSVLEDLLSLCYFVTITEFGKGRNLFSVRMLKVLKKGFACVISATFLIQQVIAGTEYFPGLHSVSLKVSGNYYLSADFNYFQPTISTARKNIFVTFRYNYEDLQTYSVYGGYSLVILSRENHNFLLSPMMGMAFGNTSGVITGIETDIIVNRLNIYSESEFVWDIRRKSPSFFFSWIDLCYSLGPARKLWAGISTQGYFPVKDRADIAEGFTVYYSLGVVTFQVYYFNPFIHDPFGILGFIVEL